MKWILYIGLVFFTSCYSPKQLNQQKLSSIQLIDRHGVRETISTEERLKSYQRSDFLLAQPYEKVVRVFTSNTDGQIISKLTSYHENGQIKQYLEVLSGRAHGTYREWYENGQERVRFTVIEGVGDLSQTALKSFIIDGLSEAWDSKGNIIARISYARGMLIDIAYLYHSNGQIKSSIPYHNGVIHGVVSTCDEQGAFIGSTSYNLGKLHGESVSTGSANNPPFEEKYENDQLVWGKYYDFENNMISHVENGNGIKSIFIEGKLAKQHEVAQGKLEGAVTCFDTTGNITNIYHLNERGEKDGSEVVYHPGTNSVQLQLQWLAGEVHGIAKTWYLSGILESEREFSHNKKEGLHLAWYIDGTMMLLEEYENDVLCKGSYYKLGKKDPISTIQRGNGTATLYDKEGRFLRRINYERGFPSEPDESVG